MLRGGSRAAATSKMERFVIIVNGFQPLTIITKRAILDVAAVLDLPLIFFKIGVHKNFAFTGQHLRRWCKSEVCNLLLRKEPNKCFPLNLAKLLRTAFFKRTPQVAAADHSEIYVTYVTNFIISRGISIINIDGND